VTVWTTLKMAATIIGVVVVALLAILALPNLSGLFTQESVGERLRRECISIIDAAGQSRAWSDSTRDRLVTDCILERGKAGKP